MKYDLFLMLSLFCALTPLQPIQAETPLIPRKELFGNPEKASPSLSPNGKKLAYLAPDEKGVLNVYVKDLTTDAPDVKVTSDTKRGVRVYFWNYDNNQILYLQDKDGDENTHLYQTSLTTKTTKDLTPFEDTKALVLAYRYEQPNQMLLMMNKRDKALFDVYKLDLVSGKLTLEMENKDNITDFTADKQLDVRAIAITLPSGIEVIKVRKDKSSPWTELMRFDPAEDRVSVSGFTKDGKYLDVASNLENNTVEFIRINLENGEREVLYHDPVFDLTSLMKDEKTGEYQAAFVDREVPVSIPLLPDVKQDFALLKKKFNEPFVVADQDLDSHNWIVVVYNTDKPSRYYLFDRKTKKVTFLFTPRKALENYAMSPMKPINIETRDGMSLLAYLSLPVDKKAQNLPTVMLVHGGPWARDSAMFDPEVQWLTNRGYAVLQVNFRGSAGLGKAYLNAGNKEWGAKMHDDLLDAKNWLVAEGISNPDKIAIYGGSYGGYATLAALAFTPEEFAAGVDLVGPSNLLTLLESLPPYWTPQKESFYKRIGNLETEKEFLKERSPLFKADQISKPLLIAQGANDPRVKQAESDQIVSKMRSHNLPVMYLLYPDEGHGFVRPENRLKFYAAAEQFLAKHLGGRAETPKGDESWETLLK